MPVGYAEPSYLEGAQFGVGTMVQGTQMGVGRMLQDLSALGSMVAPVEQVPVTPAHKVYSGMQAYEMSWPGAMWSAFGAPALGIPRVGTPPDMLALEWQQRAAGFAGERVGQTAATAGVYGAAAIGGLGLFGVMSKIGSAGANPRSIGAMLGVSNFYKAGAGIATAMGATGSGLGSMVARGAMGVGVAAGATILPVMAVDAMAEALVEDIQDRSEIMNYLQNSSFRYMGGQGFNRQDRGKITKSITDQAAGDYRYSIGELKGILQTGTQIGLFEGTRDAEDFQRKFKGLTDHLSTITKILHQSLNEGLQTIKVLKDMGYSTPAQQMQAVAGAGILGAASGLTAAEMLAVGAQGAQTLLGTGISMQAGAKAAQMGMFGVKTLLSSGIISQEDVAHAGGAESMVQRMTVGGLQFAQSPYGRGLLMGMSRGGEINLEDLGAFVSGKKSMWDLYGQGAGEMSSAQNYMKYVLNQPENISKMMQAFGGMGGLLVQGREGINIAKEIKGYFGGDMNTTFRYVMQEVLKMNPTDTKTLLGMIENPEKMDAKFTEGLRTEGTKYLYEKSLERTSMSAEIQRMRSQFSFRGLADNIGKWSDSIAQDFEDWRMDASGVGRGLKVMENVLGADTTMDRLQRDRFKAREEAKYAADKAGGLSPRPLVRGGASSLSGLTDVSRTDVLVGGRVTNLGMRLNVYGKELGLTSLDEREFIEGTTDKDYVKVVSSMFGPEKKILRSQLEDKVRDAARVTMTEESYAKILDAPDVAQLRKNLGNDMDLRRRLSKAPDTVKGTFGGLAATALGADWRSHREWLTPEAQAKLEDKSSAFKTDALTLSDFTPEGQRAMAVIGKTEGGAADEAVRRQVEGAGMLKRVGVEGLRGSVMSVDEAKKSLTDSMFGEARSIWRGGRTTGVFSRMDSATMGSVQEKLNADKTGALQSALTRLVEGKTTAPLVASPEIIRLHQIKELEDKGLSREEATSAVDAYGKSTKDERDKMKGAATGVEQATYDAKVKQQESLLRGADEYMRKAIGSTELFSRGETITADKEARRRAGRATATDAYSRIVSGEKFDEAAGKEFLDVTSAKNDPNLARTTATMREAVQGAITLGSLGTAKLTDKAFQDKVTKLFADQNVSIDLTKRFAEYGGDRAGLIADLQQTLVQTKRGAPVKGAEGVSATAEGMQNIAGFAETVAKQTAEIKELLGALTAMRDQLQQKLKDGK